MRILLTILCLFAFSCDDSPTSLNEDCNGVYEGNAQMTEDCGCILNLKVRSMSASCPIGEWNAFMDEETEKKLKDSLE